MTRFRGSAIGEVIPILVRAPAVRVVLLAALLAGATWIVALLQGAAVAAAASVYVVPVAAAAVLLGTPAAAVVTVLSVGIYDFLFTEPRYALTVDDPQDLVDLVVFLFVAIVVGRLTALLSARAAEAQRRAAEAQALFAVSRHLAVARDLEAALPDVLARLALDAGMSSVWVTLGGGPGERVVAAAGHSPAAPSGAITTLVRTPAEDEVRWVRTREPGVHAAGPADATVYRVKLEAEGAVVGSLWATRPRTAPEPGRSHARLLALAADQIALAVLREQLAEAATGAEVARRSDRLKSALLDSVSHDLRTPLAGIRALAGGLMDPAVEPSPAERRRAAASIDAEAQRLDRLVRDLLDAGRVEGGGLRPRLEACDLEALVMPVLERMRERLGGRPTQVDLPGDLPPVRVDPLFVEQVVANLLDNVARHAAPAVPVRVAAVAMPPAGADGDGTPAGTVRLVVEDGGPGLPDEEAAALFLPGGLAPGPRRGGGLGLGTTIVRGLTESMGGAVRADASPLGGLRVTVDLPAVTPPDETA